MRQVLKQRITYLAWERRLDLVGAPLGARAAEPGAAGVEVMPQQKDALRNYVAEHKDALARELAERRQARREDLERLQPSATPLTQQQWVQWFEDNAVAFRSRMRDATSERRQCSVRLSVATDAPEDGRRLQPRTSAATESNLGAGWPALLRLRHGWFALSLQRGVRLLVVYAHDGVTYCLDISRFRGASMVAIRKETRKLVNIFHQPPIGHPGTALGSDPDNAGQRVENKEK